MILKIHVMKWFLIICITTIIKSNATDSCKCENDGFNIEMTCYNDIDIKPNDAHVCFNATQILMTYFSSYITRETSQVVSRDTFLNLNKYKSLQGYISHLRAANNMWATLKSSAFKDFRNCWSLDLTGNKIKMIENGAFQGLKLLSLNLSHNAIELLYPKSLDTNLGYPHLIELNLAFNFLKYISFNVFSQLRYLKYLNLEGNKIKYLEVNCFVNMNKLTYLNLQDNNLNGLNQTLYPLVSLKTLDLSSNNLSQITSFDLENLKSLESINISNNTINNVDLGCYLTSKTSDIVHLPCKSFIFFYHLNTVHLTNNRVPFPETYGLYRWISLEFLNISNNNIRNYDLINNFSLLTTLDISKCNINKIHKLEFYHGRLTTLITDYNNIINMSMNEFSYNFKRVKYLGLRGTSICCDKINEIIKIGINVTLIDSPGNKCNKNCRGRVPEQSTTTDSTVQTTTEQITDNEKNTYEAITDIDSLSTVTIIINTVATDSPISKKTENTNYLLWILLTSFLILVIVLFIVVYVKKKKQGRHSFVVHHINIAASTAE